MDLIQDYVTELIEKGDAWKAVQELPDFPEYSLDVDTAEALCDRGFYWPVVYNKNKFEGLDINALAVRGIQSSHGGAVVRSLREQFPGVDHNLVIDNLFEVGEGILVIKNFAIFDVVDHQAIVDRANDSGLEEVVAEYLYTFRDIDHQAFFDRLLANGKGGVLARYADNFHGIDAVAVDAGERGRGTKISALYHRPNGGELQLIIDAKCVSWEGKPSETVEKVRRNMANNPEQWAGSSPELVNVWTADVNEALDLILEKMPIAAR